MTRKNLKREENPTRKLSQAGHIEKKGCKTKLNARKGRPGGKNGGGGISGVRPEIRKEQEM